MLGWLLLKSMGFGLAVAAPVGPMSLLCMRRTLAQGWRPGLATGAGIATGDGVYACVVALGLAGLSSFMMAHERAIHLVAGVFLIYLGLRIVLAKPGSGTAAPASGSVARAFGSAFLLTLTNPPTILTFAAIFTSMEPDGGFTSGSAAITVAGVLAGSMGWWIGVVAIVSTLRHAIGPLTRRWIDRIAGSALALLGAAEAIAAVA